MQRIFLNVGYELTEKQLRAYLVQFGVLSDLYLPKHSNGRNKGYGFATFASAKSLALALQQPKHVIDGITVQVSRAGVRPPDIAKDVKNAAPARAQQAPPFGKGPRVYVGGVPDFVTGERVREHFSQWGFVTDVYFPSNKGQKRMNYCFVSFQAQQSAERACNESPRNLDGWPLESISLAEDRKSGPASFESTASPASGAHNTPLSPDFDLVKHPGPLDAASLPGYVAQLQLRYQQHLAAAMASMSSPTPAPSRASANQSYTAKGFDLTRPLAEEHNPWSQANFGHNPASNDHQWADSFMPQPMQGVKEGFEPSPQTFSAPGCPSLADILAQSRGDLLGANSGTSEYSADNLTFLAQQSMANAAAERLYSQASLSDYNSAVSSAFAGNSAEGFPVSQHDYYGRTESLPYLG